MVSAYDVRPAARSEVASLGAKFIELTSVESGGGEGGYARILTEEEQAAIQAELAEHIARHDIVITTAQVPGQVPPLMVTAATVKAMRPGSVIVDLAASELGGNVEGSRPDETLVTTNGVTIVGAPNLPSAMANAASAAYARNITALFLYIVHDGEVVIDTSDEVQRGVVVTYGGEVVHPAVRALLHLPPNGPRADPDDDSGLSGHHGVVGPDTGPVS